MGSNNGTPLPRITDEQRREALRKGVALRMERASIKRAMKRGELSPAEAIGMEAARGMRASEFIGAVPGYGKVMTAALMRALKISPTRRVRGLGRRQLDALMGVLADVD